MTCSLKDLTILALSFIVIGAFILDGYLIMSGAVKTADPQMLLLIGNVSGASQTFAGVVIAFWFGTSKASAEKDKIISDTATSQSSTIASIADKIPPVPSTQTVTTKTTNDKEKAP